jgi:23S rRNA (adenine1618-N6)-methyltransferase
MHPRNKHQGDYDFKKLVLSSPRLKPFIKKSPAGKLTIDFAIPDAVKQLNAALLASDYDISTWDIPDGYLCPPIPGRADYIHHIADLLAHDNADKVLKGKSVIGLDIGAGANLIYPIIGSQSYGWRFIGSDIDKAAIQSANMIIKMNEGLEKHISIRKQQQPNNIFHGIIHPQDRFTFTLCNPPFHASAKAAAEGNQRKNTNLSRHKEKHSNEPQKSSRMSPKNLNFAGKSNELWCQGGELSFIKRMIKESSDYKTQVQWFTTLVSKKDNMKPILNALKHINANEVKTIPMQQGNKSSRFIAWQF